MSRALLDSLGGHDIKILPASEDMLANTVREAVRADEMDWGLPRPADWVRGGGWGAQRAVLFSGLPVAAQVRPRAHAGRRMHYAGRVACSTARTSPARSAAAQTHTPPAAPPPNTPGHLC